ncbi:MAG: autoinducer-2 kinase [Lacrimispora sp.]|uniref:autoinducer-2 kinase n=1 Tax=Lacrimispora sp. TaxID=2719234 RepID=UPI0039E4E462
MIPNYLLAIDAGTGSVRAVLFDRKGNQISCIQEEWDHKEDPRYPGSMDFDWNHNWKLASSCIQRVITSSSISPQEIAAISTTCMREGIILYDREGKEIWACANVDARSDDEVIQLIRQDPELERLLYLESGQSYALDALPRLLWVKNKMPDIYERIAYIGMFNDWLCYKLTGLLAVEPSNGSTTGLFDLKSRSWNPDIAKRAGLRDDIFPLVKECGTVLGKTVSACTGDTGLVEGIPVVVGGGDAQLGCIGIGAVDAGQAAVFGGSFWQYEYNTDKPDTDSDCRVRVNCHAIPGIWQYEALAFQPGLVMRWYRDSFCLAEKKIGKETGRSAYDLMNEEAEKIPAGCHGMMCAFSDVMNFINWKHAAPTFSNFGLDPEKYNHYTFYRAILENTALITKGHLELVEQATGNRPNEIIFAGGASNSPLWAQILSDVLGLPVKVPKVKEATALGAAILAGHGIGMFEDISETARELVAIERHFTPNMENHRIYSSIYSRWREFYQAQLGLCDRKITKNMWIAPGL